MPNFEDKQAYSSLIELIAHWRSGGTGSVDQADIQRLEQLIGSSELGSVASIRDVFVGFQQYLYMSEPTKHS